jgi:hypothetical protein
MCLRCIPVVFQGRGFNIHFITSRPREVGVYIFYSSEECRDSISGIIHISFWLILLYTFEKSPLDAKKNWWRSDNKEEEQMTSRVTS